VTISGGAASLGFSIGGSVTDGVILAGHLWGIGAVNPSITVNGNQDVDEYNDARVDCSDPPEMAARITTVRNASGRWRKLGTLPAAKSSPDRAWVESARADVGRSPGQT